MVVLLIHDTEEKNKFKHAVSEGEYEISVNLVKGEFNTHTTSKKYHDQILESNIEIYSGQFYANHVIS